MTEFKTQWVEFGNYLLSKDRKKNLKTGSPIHHVQPSEMNRVHDVDLVNWRDLQEKGK